MFQSIRSRFTRQGSALILVLVLMLIMSFILLTAIDQSKQDTHAAYRTVRQVQARYLAEGALERAKGDVLCQIAATNFLGGSFATVGSLYENINNRFNVDDKRIPSTTASEAIDWEDSTTIARARWDFVGDDTLDLAGINDWGIDDDGEPIGETRVYITRAIIDEMGDANNNTVGSYNTTLTAWARVGGDVLPAVALSSKSYSHGLIFPRLFDFLYLGNALSDCSMCHLKIMGDIGQVNAADPFEMHISYDSSRFNRLTLYGSIYTNGVFRRSAQAEGSAANRARQERMMFAPGGDNVYGKPLNGVVPKSLIFAENGAALSAAWESDGSATGANPYRAIETLATPLPQTWPSVKKNLLGWFEPRSTGAVASGNSSIQLDMWDNNVGHLTADGVPNDNSLAWIPATTLGPLASTRPITYFQPYVLPTAAGSFGSVPSSAGSVTMTDFQGLFRTATANTLGWNASTNPLRYMPFALNTARTDGANPLIVYGAQDHRTETISGTSVTGSTAADGFPDADLTENGTLDAADEARRIYPAAIDRATERVGSVSARYNVNSSAARTLVINKGLHPVDDFDMDTIPNGFDPDFDGDGIPESPRASSDATTLGFHVTTNMALTEGWITWVNEKGQDLGVASTASGRRPQWTLGYQRIRFARATAPFDVPADSPVFWVRRGAVQFLQMSNNNVPARPGSGVARTNYDNGRTASNNQAIEAMNVLINRATPQSAAFSVTPQDVIVWPIVPTATTQKNPDPGTVWAAYGSSRCYPIIHDTATNRTESTRMWSTLNASGLLSYRRANQDVMLSGNISRMYSIVDANPVNLATREFAWQADISGVASAGGGRTAMQNLILNRFANTNGHPAGTVRGVFPNAALNGSGDPVLAADPGERSLVIRGTRSNPIRVNGQVVIRGDVVATGFVTGKGVIISHRNIFVPADFQYLSPPNYLDFNSTAGDQIGLIAAGNILVGNVLHNTTGRTDMMEFVWGNMVDINSAEITGATSWNYGADGTAQPSKNHMINPIYLYDGDNGGFWQNGEWVVTNEGNTVDERFKSDGTTGGSQAIRIGGGLKNSGATFIDARRHINFTGNSNPSTTNDSTSRYTNFWISTPGLLPEGASKITAMPSTYFGEYTGAWFSPLDFKMFTLWPRLSTNNWTNSFRGATGPGDMTAMESQNRWIRIIEGVLYADNGVIGGNIPTAGPNFLEFKGGIIGKDIQILSAIASNASGDNGALRPVEDFIGQHRVGGLYYDHRLKGAINPLGFPFTELFLGGEMAQSYMPDLVDGDRDNWIPFRLTAEYKSLVEN